MHVVFLMMMMMMIFVMQERSDKIRITTYGLRLTDYDLRIRITEGKSFTTFMTLPFIILAYLRYAPMTKDSYMYVPFSHVTSPYGGLGELLFAFPPTVTHQEKEYKNKEFQKGEGLGPSPLA